MATRRTIFHRKEKPRSISKTGLLLCLLLAGGVLLVPVGGDIVQTGKLRLRDWALDAGLIDFQDCVVTAEHALTCSSRAAGIPLPVALRQIKDRTAEAAAEKEQRLKAERKVRELAMEIERLSDELERAKLAARAVGSFTVPSGDIRPTGLTVTNPSTGSLMTTTTTPQHGQAEHAPPSLVTPPAEEE